MTSALEGQSRLHDNEEKQARVLPGALVVELEPNPHFWLLPEGRVTYRRDPVISGQLSVLPVKPNFAWIYFFYTIKAQKWF